MQVSALQFIMFELLSLVFSLVIWYACRMLVDSH